MREIWSEEIVVRKRKMDKNHQKGRRKKCCNSLASSVFVHTMHKY